MTLFKLKKGLEIQFLAWNRNSPEDGKSGPLKKQALKNSKILISQILFNLCEPAFSKVHLFPPFDELELLYQAKN